MGRGHWGEVVVVGLQVWGGWVRCNGSLGRCSGEVWGQGWGRGGGVVLMLSPSLGTGLKQELFHRHKEAQQCCRPHNLPLLRAAQQREMEVRGEQEGTATPTALHTRDVTAPGSSKGRKQGMPRSRDLLSYTDKEEIS